MPLVFGSLNADLLFQVEARRGRARLCRARATSWPPAARARTRPPPRPKPAQRCAGSRRRRRQLRPVIPGDALAEAGVDGARIETSEKADGCRGDRGRPRGREPDHRRQRRELDSTRARSEDALSAPGTTFCARTSPAQASFELLLAPRRRGARTILDLALAGAVPGRVVDALDLLVVNEVEAAMAAGARPIRGPGARPGGPPRPDLRHHPERRGAPRIAPGGGRRRGRPGPGGRGDRRGRCLHRRLGRRVDQGVWGCPRRPPGERRRRPRL